MPDSSCADTKKPYLKGLMFTHKNGCGDAFSVTERSCASTISKVKSHISDKGELLHHRENHTGKAFCSHLRTMIAAGYL